MRENPKNFTKLYVFQHMNIYAYFEQIKLMAKNIYLYSIKNNKWNKNQLNSNKNQMKRGVKFKWGKRFVAE